MAEKPLKEWNTGLFDCFTSATTFCYGFWCCPCLACTVSQQFGESRCLPLCDILSPGTIGMCGIPLCAPPAGLSIRAAMRNRYGIKGYLCDDIAISCFCSWCSWCQMHRELKHRRKQTNVINAQPSSAMLIPANPAPVNFMSSQNVVVVNH